MVAAGLTVEEALTNAGDRTEELRPLVEIVAEIPDIRQTIPIPPPDASLQRMLSHGEALAAADGGSAASRPWWQTILPGFSGWDWSAAYSRGLLATVIATGLLLICLGGGIFGGSVVLAAEDSLPGEALYRVKQLGETVRLFLAENDAKQRWLLEDFSTRRTQEVQRLLERGDRAAVAITGQIDSVTGSELMIGGLTIQVRSDTRIDGRLQVGSRVRVAGITQPPSLLIASSIVVLEVPPPTPTSTTTPTLIPTAPSATSTATSRPARESTSDTIRLAPTATSTTTPTTLFVQPAPTSNLPAANNDNADDSDKANDNDNRDDKEAANDNENTDNENENEDEDNDNEAASDNENNENENEDEDPDEDSDNEHDDGQADNSGSGSSGSEDSDDRSGSDSNGNSGPGGGGDDSRSDDDDKSGSGGGGSSGSNGGDDDDED
jgi:uncharacterized membrane protein YgcG